MLIRWLLNALALLVVTYVFPGWIHLSGLATAAVAAVLLGIVNAIIRPVALVLTLPLNIVTLGLFTFVINAAMLIFVAWILPGMEVHGFLAAILASVAISIVSGVASWLIRR